MAEKSRKVYYENRAWLNPPGDGNAYIAGEVETTVYDSGPNAMRELSAELNVSDCHRVASLNFSVWHGDDTEELDKTEAKVDLLYKEVRAFHKALKKAIAEERRRRPGKVAP